MAREHAPDDLVRAVIALGGLLRQAVAEALAPHDVTPEQQELLALLASGLRSPPELVQASGRDKTTLSRAVTRATSAGLVTHERRPAARCSAFAVIGSCQSSKSLALCKCIVLHCDLQNASVC